MCFGTLICKAQSFELKKQNDSLYYLNGWRLPYPVYQYQTGDVDGDGHVTINDVTVLYNYILNNDSSSIVNGDQDGDGSITAGDVTFVYNILLGTE